MTSYSTIPDVDEAAVKQWLYAQGSLANVIETLERSAAAAKGLARLLEAAYSDIVEGGATPAEATANMVALGRMLGLLQGDVRTFELDLDSFTEAFIGIDAVLPTEAAAAG